MHRTGSRSLTRYSRHDLTCYKPYTCDDRDGGASPGLGKRPLEAAHSCSEPGGLPASMNESKRQGGRSSQIRRIGEKTKPAVAALSKFRRDRKRTVNKLQNG